MKRIENVTLLGIDCVDIDRLILAANICLKDFEFGAVKLLTSLPSDNPHIVPIPPIRSIREYSQFVLKNLADYVDTEFVMIIQHDGFILNPSAWSDEFLAYDYIGAPWYIKGKLIVGNGGFNIRSKKLLELTKSEMIQLGPSDSNKLDQNEDWVICTTHRSYLEKAGIRFAPPELAHRFSIEGNKKYGSHWKDEFGFHGLRWTNIRRWLREHPEYPIDNPCGAISWLFKD